MSEYIGSLIALISKSDLKYVGTLKAIDSETATVSLEEVQCLGTEGRTGDPAKEQPGSSEIYSGIVFRGSDVKDLTIISPPKENKAPQMPNDPAILGAPQQQPPPPQQTPQQQPLTQPPPPNQQPQRPPQFSGPPPPFPGPPNYHYPGPPQFQQHSRFQGPGGPHGFPGSPGAVPGYGYPPPPGYGMPMGYPPGPGFPPPPGPFQSPQQAPIGPPGSHLNRPHPQTQSQQQPPPTNPPQQRAPPVGSKQNTPQPATAQAPPPPNASAQVNPAEVPTAAAAPPTTASTSKPPPPPVESKPTPSEVLAPPTQVTSKPTQRADPRVALPLPTSSPAVQRAQPKPTTLPQTQPPLTGFAVPPPANATDAATAAVAKAMADLGNKNKQADGMDNLAQKVNQMRLQDGQARGRGRGRGQPRGARRDGAQKTVEVPKEDFDFAGANAKFNKHDLVKEAIASGHPVGTPVNGDGIADVPVSSTTNGHIEDVVIPPKPVTEKGYDKKSSFFDNISSDLRDRTEQQNSHDQIDGRSIRREERTKNVETFGQGSVDGGYRGRGRGRGGRSGYRGGRGNGGYNNFNSRGGPLRGRGRGGLETAPVN